MDHSRISIVTGAPAPIHHALMVAGAAARQAGTRTAAIAERIERHRPAYTDAVSALAGVFAVSDGAAAPLLVGSFHPRIAHADVNGGSILMKPGFTLAF